MKINDECFPFETGIHTNKGVIKIGNLYNMFDNKELLPLILSFNQINKNFEYKKMTFAWQKENKKLLKIYMSKKYIKCTEKLGVDYKIRKFQNGLGITVLLIENM